MLWAITGGAGFLGLHLSRRLLADGHEVRSLDVAPLDDAELEQSVTELRGDIRDPVRVRELCAGADVVVHAAAALPIQATRDSIRSVNVGGTENVVLAARESGVRRLILVSSTAVYGVPEKHPIEEDDPLVGVGHYGESKIDAERLVRVANGGGLETVIIRPKTFIGAERLGVFEILFDQILDGEQLVPVLPAAEHVDPPALADPVEEDLEDAQPLRTDERLRTDDHGLEAATVRNAHEPLSVDL
ncbi:MAG: hypothetical protein QOF50_1504, partial [Gaiellaceae bacterium]|nr:hypothetical protein [Gaiellaceae bacterium]